jgi:hypothetical protein
MLRSFAICDDDLGGRQVGTFSYNTETKQFSMTISSDIEPKDLPLSLELFVINKKYDLSHEDTMRFIRGRICPPGRHNIIEILRDNNLEEYDEFNLLMLTKARCDKDGLFIAE